MADYRVAIRRVDFGNAPDPFHPTVWAHNRARHDVDPACYLGKLLDWEADGPDGPPLADEDGVVLTTALVPGLPAEAEVILSVDGKLDAFVDFNRNGSWTDAGECFTAAGGTTVVAGLNTVSFTVPSGATGGPTWARFRFSDTGGLSSTSPAAIEPAWAEEIARRVADVDAGRVAGRSVEVGLNEMRAASR